MRNGSCARSLALASQGKMWVVRPNEALQIMNATSCLGRIAFKASDVMILRNT